MELQELIQSGLDYIEDNLQAEITAAELAQMVHVSEFHYYRLFQKATGVPVMQYILRRRLLHGIYAMQQGSSKIDVALAYGFDTYAGFYRAFSREFGTTPYQYQLNEKMRIARRLLRSTMLPVSEIAAMLGYRDISYFSALFREKNGTSPGKYRK